MPDLTPEQRQAAIEEMRRRNQPMSLRELIVRIMAEAQGQQTVNGQIERRQ